MARKIDIYVDNSFVRRNLSFPESVEPGFCGHGRLLWTLRGRSIWNRESMHQELEIKTLYSRMLGKILCGRGME